jgi:hypothetical protein
MLYRIITGRPPHTGSDANQQSACAIAGNIVRPLELRPELPAELEAITIKALSLRSTERFKDVAAFQEALSAYREHATSLVLSTRCRAQLRSLAAAEETDVDVRYTDLDKIIAGFQQALALWPRNLQANTGIRDARLLYFRTAMNNDDLQMARMVVDALNTWEESRQKEDATSYISMNEGDTPQTALPDLQADLNIRALEAELAEAWAKRRRQHKILGFAAVALALALIIGVTIPLTIWMTMKDPAELMQAETQIGYTLDMIGDMKESRDLRKAVEILQKSPNQEVRGKAQAVLDQWAAK